MEKKMSDQNKKENQTEIKLILVKDKKRPTSYVRKEIQEIVAAMVTLGNKRGRPSTKCEEELYAA